MDIVKHEGATPRPWHIAVDEPSGIGRTHSVYICNADGWPEGQIARINVQDGYREREANAALIVHAVNSIESLTAERDALREALEAAFEFLGGCDGATEIRDTILSVLTRSQEPHP